LFLSALRQAGHQPFVVSRLRSFDGDGNPARQDRIAAIGERLAARLLGAGGCGLISRRRHGSPTTSTTKHRIGSGACQRRACIPYIVAEASHAAKRAGGPWALGHVAVARAIRRADGVIGLNSADRDGIVALVGGSERCFAMRRSRRCAFPPSARAGCPLRLIAWR